MAAIAEDLMATVTEMVSPLATAANPANAANDANANAAIGSNASKITEEPKKKVKKERQIPIPKDSATFFRARAKDPKKFTFTADGNLQVPEMRGEPAKVIPLPFYRPATAEEIREVEAKQFEDIKGLEKEIDETSKLLRDALIEWRATGSGGVSDVLKYQRDLQRLDAQRTQLRYPVRWAKTFKNPAINTILTDQFYEKRKIGYPVSALQTRGISFEQSIRSSSSAFASAEGSASEGEGEGEGEEREIQEHFIIFYDTTDPEHGLLSPDTMVEFIFNSTQYTSLIQAYQGERVAALGRKDLRPSILKSRNPRQIRLLGSKVVGQVENPRELWINILKSLVSQHPRFADMLRATGNDTLVFADPRDGVLGVGLALEDPLATDRNSWKGENILGQAWQAVRASVQQGEEKEQKGGSLEFTESATTKNEVNERRANVLKGLYRKRA
jgi:ribA/ribD-fused uncharacterized protein